MAGQRTTLVLVRHGESEFNRDNIFTGWRDPDLTKRGEEEARDAGKILQEHGYEFDVGFTSVLKRAIKTLFLIQDELDCLWMPVTKTWLLNERHYGQLQGKRKDEMVQQYGPEQVRQWRRSFKVRPPPLTESDDQWAGTDRRYVDLESVPASESSEDTLQRSIPFWEDHVLPALREGKRPIVCGHSNVLRNLVQHIGEGRFTFESADMALPNAMPLVLDLDEDLRPIKYKFLPHKSGAKAAKKRNVNS